MMYEEITCRNELCQRTGHVNFDADNLTFGKFVLEDMLWFDVKSAHDKDYVAFTGICIKCKMEELENKLEGRPPSSGLTGFPRTEE